MRKLIIKKTKGEYYVAIKIDHYQPIEFGYNPEAQVVLGKYYPFIGLICFLKEKGWFESLLKRLKEKGMRLIDIKGEFEF